MVFFTLIGIIAVFFVIKFFYDDYQKVSAERHNQKINDTLKKRALHYIQLAKPELEENNYNLAIEYIKLAISNDPSEPFYKEILSETIKEKAQFLYIQSSDFYNKCLLDTAYDLINEACSLCPDNKDYQNVRFVLGAKIAQRKH